MSNLFRKEIEKEFTSKIKEIGFKKKQYYFVKPISNNILGTIYLCINSFREKRHKYIDITVGVSHKNVEDLYVKLIEGNPKIFQSTIGIQLGYLMPENMYKEWDFEEGRNNSYLYEDIIKCIQTYAIPYMEKMKNFEKLLEAFQKRVPEVLNIARDRYLPILYYLKGDKQKGLEFIEDAIVRMGIRPTDEEIRMGDKPENVIILRAGEQPVMTGDEMEKAFGELPSGGKIIIVGSGQNGEIEPSYLKFVENYRKL